MKLATLCYLRSEGKTLMLHRTKKKDDMHAGKWNGLGGKLEPGESPEECVAREVYEESGLVIQDPCLRGVLTFPQFSKGEDWYAFVYVAHRYSGQVGDSAEGVLAWIEDARLLDLDLWEGDRIFIPWLDRDLFFSGKFIYDEGSLVRYEAHFYSPDGTSFSERKLTPDAGLA